MVNQFPLQDFFEHSQEVWSQLPDHRKPNPNTRYAISDAVNSAFSVFFMQSQSFLAHQQTIKQKRKGKKNLQNLFQVENVPSDNQIRNLLDPLKPDQFAPQFEWIWQTLKSFGALTQYTNALGTKSIALDWYGLPFFNLNILLLLLNTPRQNGNTPLLSCHASTFDGQAWLRACFGLLS